MYLCRLENVPQVEFMYLVLPGESYRRRLRSLLLYLCDIFWALINSLVFWCHSFQLQQYLQSIRAVVIANHSYFFFSFFPSVMYFKDWSAVSNRQCPVTLPSPILNDEKCPVTLPWRTVSSDIAMMNSVQWYRHDQYWTMNNVQWHCHTIHW